MIVVEGFDEIAGNKLHVIEFRKVKDMRFQKHGSGNVKLVTDVGELVEKAGIGKAFLLFVNELFLNFSVGD